MSDDPHARALLRRALAALMLLLPAMCALPALILIAPDGPIRMALLAVSLLLAALIAWLIWRTFRRLRVE